MTVAGIGESFAGVLEELSFDNGIGRTGCLYVMAVDERHAGRIYLYEGQVYAIHVDGFRPRFIQRMHVGGYISDAQRDDLIARCGGPYSENAGTVAMESGMVPDHLVEVMYREMLLSAAGAMASWGPIRTIFEPGEQTQAFAVKPLSVTALNTAVRKRREKWNELWQTVCPTSPIEGAFPRSLITPQQADAQGFPAEVAALTAVCDGRTRFDEVAGLLGLTRFETVIFLGLLLERNVITFDNIPNVAGTLPPLDETLEFSDALPDGSQDGAYAHEAILSAPESNAPVVASEAGVSVPAPQVSDEDEKGKKERRFFRRNKKKKDGADDMPLLSDDEPTQVEPFTAPEPTPVAEEVLRTAPELNPDLVSPSEAVVHPTGVEAPSADAAPVPPLPPVLTQTEAPAAPAVPQMPPVFVAPQIPDPLSAPVEMILPPVRSDVPPLGAPMTLPPVATEQSETVSPVAAPVNPFVVAAPAPAEVADEAPLDETDYVAQAADEVSDEPVAEAVVPEEVVFGEAGTDEEVYDQVENAVDADFAEPDSAEHLAVVPPLPALPPMPAPYAVPAPPAVPGYAAELGQVAEDSEQTLAAPAEPYEAVPEVPEVTEVTEVTEPTALDTDWGVAEEQFSEGTAVAEAAVEESFEAPHVDLPPMPAVLADVVTEEHQAPTYVDDAPAAPSSNSESAAFVESEYEVGGALGDFTTEVNAQQDGEEYVEALAALAVAEAEAVVADAAESLPPVEDEVPVESFSSEETFVAEQPLAVDALVEESQVEETPVSFDLLAHARATVDDAVVAKTAALEMRDQAKQRLVDLEAQVTEAVSMESNAYDDKAACVEASQMAKVDLRSARENAHAAEAARVAAAEALREAQERYAHAESVALESNQRVGLAEQSVVEQADALNAAFARLRTAAQVTAQSRSDLALATASVEVAEQTVKHCKDVLSAARDALETLEED